MNIHHFFSQTSVDLPALAHFLDGLEPALRVQEAGRLAARQQAQLFDAAAGFRSVRLSDIVPAGTPPLQEVIHYGRNSLPVIYFFEKRFCLPETAAAVLWGYNEWRYRTLTGPGYFVARQAGELEVVIDYCVVPPARPASWPPVRPNSVKLSRFIYYQMQDFLRDVSQHVTVEQTTRQSKPLNNWFILCRSDI